MISAERHRCYCYVAIAAVVPVFVTMRLAIVERQETVRFLVSVLLSHSLTHSGETAAKQQPQLRSTSVIDARVPGFGTGPTDCVACKVALSS